MHTTAFTGMRKQTKLVCTCTSTTVCTGVGKQTKLVCTCKTVYMYNTTCVGIQTKFVKLKVVCTYKYNSMYRCGETKLVCTCTTVCTVQGNKLVCTCTTVCTGVGKQNLFAIVTFVHHCTGVGRWLHMLPFHTTRCGPRVLAEEC